MINREMKTVVYRVFNKTQNQYGELKQVYDDQLLRMMIKIQGQVNTEDPRYVDCDSIGLTKETVKPGNKIIDGDKTYLIKYVIPSSRYQQVMLKCEQ